MSKLKPTQQGELSGRLPYFACKSLECGKF